MIKRDPDHSQDEFPRLKYIDFLRLMGADNAQHTATNTAELYALRSAGFACRLDLLDQEIRRLQIRIEKLSRYEEVSVNELLDAMIERNELVEQWDAFSHNQLFL